MDSYAGMADEVREGGEGMITSVCVYHLLLLRIVRALYPHSAMMLPLFVCPGLEHCMVLSSLRLNKYLWS